MDDDAHAVGADHAHDARQTRLSWVDLAVLAALMFLYIGVEVGFSTWAFTLLDRTGGSDAMLAAAVPLLFWLVSGAGALHLALAPQRGRPAPTFASVPSAFVLTAAVLSTFALSASLLVAMLAAPLMGWVQGPIYTVIVARAGTLPAGGWENQRRDPLGQLPGCHGAAGISGAAYGPGPEHQPPTSTSRWRRGSRPCRSVAISR